ncbi:MAG: dual specificity protein phosphatase family protein [Acidobacteriia bacterium]|nr:dual specificity protein phosphatase family protein [Terriglobia bacterium]
MGRTFRSFQVLAVALLLAITISAGEEPQQKGVSSASHPAHVFGQKRKITGVGNFGEVTPALFRGAQPTHEGLAALAKMGIGIVVDAHGNQANNEGKEVGKLGMQYVAIPWHCPFPNDDVFVRFLKLLQENPDKKVFVHCRLGEDRTGMMVAAYRMAAQGWTADEAMREMHQFGFSTIHHLICPGLPSYEKRFPQHLQSNPAFDGLRSSRPNLPK